MMRTPKLAMITRTYSLVVLIILKTVTKPTFLPFTTLLTVSVTPSIRTEITVVPEQDRFTVWELYWGPGLKSIFLGSSPLGQLCTFTARMKHLSWTPMLTSSQSERLLLSESGSFRERSSQNRILLAQTKEEHNRITTMEVTRWRRALDPVSKIKLLLNATVTTLVTILPRMYLQLPAWIVETVKSIAFSELRITMEQVDSISTPNVRALKIACKFFATS